MPNVIRFPWEILAMNEKGSIDDELVVLVGVTPSLFTTPLRELEGVLTLDGQTIRASNRLTSGTVSGIKRPFFSLCES